MPTEDLPSAFGKHLSLPDHLRKELRVPLGRLVDGESYKTEVKGLETLVTVGDYCTVEALESSTRPKLAVVDMKVERRGDERMKVHLSSEEAVVVEVANPPAEISSEVWHALERAYRSPGRSIIKISGEEDLVALPAIALAPAETTIAYGQPGQGVVLVEVNDESRNRVERLMERMEVVDGS